MRKLIVFNQVSLDGYFVDAQGEMNWAHKDPNDAEWNEFVAGNASGGGALVFGRVTYDLMAGFWPTPMAAQMAPEVAKQMNALEKIVFSRTLTQATWNNTLLLKGDPATEMRTLKQRPGPDMAILGSGTIVAQLGQAGLVDEFQLIVNPLILGKGRTLFEGVAPPLNLKLGRTRTFRNGSVLLCYEPAR